MKRMIIEMSALTGASRTCSAAIVREEKLLRFAELMLLRPPNWLRGQDPRNVARHFAIRVANYALENALGRAREDAGILMKDLAEAHGELARWRAWYASAQSEPEPEPEPAGDTTYAEDDVRATLVEVAG